MHHVRRQAVGWSLVAVAAWLTCWAMALVVRRLLQLLASPTPADPRELVTLLLALAALGLAGWLGLTTATALLAHLPGPLGRLAGRVTSAVAPATARRAAAFLLGVSLGAVAAPGSSAAADSAPVAPTVSAADLPYAGWGPTAPTAPTLPVPVSVSGPALTVPEPGWVPARPVVRPQPGAGLLLSAPPGGDRPAVVVLRGDTLWSIAAHALGPGATDAEIAAAWPRWHAANRAVIGADPDLLLPGQVLHAPGAAR